MKTYWAAFLMRAKMEAQYRAAALSGLATQLFFGLILVYLYRALYGAGADLATLASTATYVWIQQAFFRMVCADDNTLTAAIIKGDMAYQLVRPVDQYNFWFARNLAMKLVGALMRAFPLLLIAALLPTGVGICRILQVLLAEHPLTGLDLFRDGKPWRRSKFPGASGAAENTAAGAQGAVPVGAGHAAVQRNLVKLLSELLL